MNAPLRIASHPITLGLEEWWDTIAIPYLRVEEPEARFARWEDPGDDSALGGPCPPGPWYVDDCDPVDVLIPWSAMGGFRLAFLGDLDDEHTDLGQLTVQITPWLGYNASPCASAPALEFSCTELRVSSEGVDVSVEWGG